MQLSYVEIEKLYAIEFKNQEFNKPYKEIIYRLGGNNVIDLSALIGVESELVTFLKEHEPTVQHQQMIKDIKDRNLKNGCKVTGMIIGAVSTASFALTILLYYAPTFPFAEAFKVFASEYSTGIAVLAGILAFPCLSVGFSNWLQCGKLESGFVLKK